MPTEFRRKILKGASIREIRLFFWRRQGRGRRHNEGIAWRERGRACGDDPHWTARSSRLHDHYGVLRLLLEARAEISGDAPRRREEEFGSPRTSHKEKTRRCEGPAPGERSIRLGPIH